jgi:hypothetical protein
MRGYPAASIPGMATDKLSTRVGSISRILLREIEPVREA